MKRFASTLLIALFITSAPGSLWAHGGGHDAEPKKEEVTLPKLPEASFGTDTTSGGAEYGMGDAEDSFEMEEVGGGGPLWGAEPQPLSTSETPPDLNKMAEHEGHDMKQMKHVEPAEHKWISSSQKGYGWAAALTLFSGALFGFLTFKRPCE